VRFNDVTRAPDLKTRHYQRQPDLLDTPDCVLYEQIVKRGDGLVSQLALSP